MKFRPTWYRVLRSLVTLAFVFGLLIAGSLFWMADPYHFKDPSDEKLIALFHQHHDAFEKLCQMAEVDSRLGYYYSGNGLPREKQLKDSRNQEYKTILSGIGSRIEMEVIPNTHTEVQFIFSTSGLLAIGPESSKGIEFVSGKNDNYEKIVQSLDDLNSLPYGYYLRLVEPKWFIFYDFID